MKNHIIINILVFALGLGTGYLITRKLLEDYYAEIADTEIDNMKEIFERREHDLKGLNKKVAPYTNNGLTDEEYEASKKDADNIAPTREAKRVPVIKTNYNEIAKSKIANQIGIHPQAPIKQNVFKTAVEKPDEDEDDEEGASSYIPDNQELDEGIDRQRPYEISADEFANEFPDHDKISLYYYAYDDTLCFENEELVDDIDGKIGMDIFEALGEESTVWVRNEPLGLDYEICLVNQSYAKEVHGATNDGALSPRERYIRTHKKDDDDEE